ncbi:hypothetical protein CBR_g20183 [Chara braunii]|uniref:OBG-type G domain-containing protein n=1 Tax=Chara braunii TaxID=69332 RepID=A0A388KZZ0_CHABU|nr:hypothetical protein CBR_g20183 [Chara braunii]|eukprot:GBG75552.1 hypothetical protein CBR_g20183 [Chara braunii]
MMTSAAIGCELAVRSYGCTRGAMSLCPDAEHRAAAWADPSARECSRRRRHVAVNTLNAPIAATAAADGGGCTCRKSPRTQLIKSNQHPVDCQLGLSCIRGRSERGSGVRTATCLTTRSATRLAFDRVKWRMQPLMWTRFTSEEAWPIPTSSTSEGSTFTSGRSRSEKSTLYSRSRWLSRRERCCLADGSSTWQLCGSLRSTPSEDHRRRSRCMSEMMSGRIDSAGSCGLWGSGVEDLMMERSSRRRRWLWARGGGRQRVLGVGRPMTVGEQCCGREALSDRETVMTMMVMMMRSRRRDGSGRRCRGRPCDGRLGFRVIGGERNRVVIASARKDTLQAVTLGKAEAGRLDPAIGVCAGGDGIASLPIRKRRSRRNTAAALSAIRPSLHLQTATQQPVNEDDALSDLPPAIAKEAHKYFDQVAILVRSGDGGDGAILRQPKPRSSKQKKGSFKRGKMKRNFDGSLVMPVGGDGSDVYLYADEGMDTLLSLHKRKKYVGKRGGNVDATVGFTGRASDGLRAAPLRIPVPVGTVVKRKRGGKLIADLCKPGDQVLVASGGRGGMSVLDVPRALRAKLEPSGVPVLEDPLDKDLIRGVPGEEVALELTLRVVADVGLVGLPNAGKSSLLAAVTEAKPAIADYPFTTLMPNLGRLGGDPNSKDGGFEKGPTMADLPGLIAGAHIGRGLGRMFLRHLRRTRLLVHIVDAAAEDPVEDYYLLREELWMYNPDYVARPHIVALNKLDIPQAAERFESLRSRLMLGAGAGSPSRLAEYMTAVVGTMKSSFLSSTEQRVSTGGEMLFTTEASAEEKEEIAGSNAESHEQQQGVLGKRFGEGTREDEEDEESIDAEEEGNVDTAKMRRRQQREMNEEAVDVAAKADERSAAASMEGEMNHRQRVLEQYQRPVAVVGISARTGEGIDDLLKQIRTILQQDDESSARRDRGGMDGKSGNDRQKSKRSAAR